MDIPLDEVIYVEAIASSSTGAAVDADSTPTFSVMEEDTDTDIGVGGNMTKRTSLTGNYRASFTASAANGFEIGKWYSVIGSATIGTIATKGVLKTFRIVAAESIAGYPKTDQHALKGDAQSATDQKDFFDTGYDPVEHKVAGVVLVDTTTTNTDMRGTDGANTVAPATASDVISAQTAIINQGNSAWVTATGFSTLTQIDIRTAVGMAAANLDTLIGAIQTVVDTNQTEILKIPRLGTTHKHRQIASNAVAKSADVIIEAAP